MTEDIRDQLAGLVKGEWVGTVPDEGEQVEWTVRLPNNWLIELVDMRDEGVFRAFLDHWPEGVGSICHAKASGPDPASALRALLSGPDSALVLGILSALKALPWREGPDSDLGRYWWMEAGEGSWLVTVDDGLIFEPQGGWQPVGPGFRWMLACPPPAPPGAP